MQDEYTRKVERDWCRAAVAQGKAKNMKEAARLLARYREDRAARDTIEWARRIICSTTPSQ